MIKSPPADTIMTSLPQQTQTIVSMRDVSKKFGTVQALKSVSFDVLSGSVHALLGANGAGKTTALSILLGLRRPDTGEVRLFDRSPDDLYVRLNVGATPQDVAFPPGVRVLEVLKFAREHYPKPEDLDVLLNWFNLETLAKQACSALSSGQKRQVAIALAFAGRPKLVFLDEPTTGLDVDSRRAVWAGLRSYVKQGGTVLLTTHYLEEVEALANRATVIHKGVVALDGSVSEIKATSPVKRYRFRAQNCELPDGTRYVENDGIYTVISSQHEAALSMFAGLGIDTREIEVLSPTLEDAFLGITGGV